MLLIIGIEEIIEVFFLTVNKIYYLRDSKIRKYSDFFISLL